jgi:hypothetical protein
VLMTIDGVLDYWIYWPFAGRTTNNYNTVAIFTLYSSLLQTIVLSLLNSPLAVSWQRILIQVL